MHARLLQDLSLLTSETLCNSIENPFYTKEYISYRMLQGYTPYLLGYDINTDCLAFMKNGRLRCGLEIPSIPDISVDDTFWQQLENFCHQKGVTDLSVNSFGSPGGIIPLIGREKSRKIRQEYILKLNHSDFMMKMSKGHAYRIKKARKLGMLVERRRDQEAITIHASLISTSMQRRKERGENVGTIIAAENLSQLMTTGVAELFCVISEDQIISSCLVLLSKKTGYSHTMGTSPEGMAGGAAHFLIHEIASILREEGKDSFNLGGTDDPNPESGLVKFKTGFGLSVKPVELQSASFRMASPISSLARRYLLQLRG